MWACFGVQNGKMHYRILPTIFHFHPGSFHSNSIAYISNGCFNEDAFQSVVLFGHSCRDFPPSLLANSSPSKSVTSSPAKKKAPVPAPRTVFQNSPSAAVAHSGSAVNNRHHHDMKSKLYIIALYRHASQ